MSASLERLNIPAATGLYMEMASPPEACVHCTYDVETMSVGPCAMIDQWYRGQQLMDEDQYEPWIDQGNHPLSIEGSGMMKKRDSSILTSTFSSYTSSIIVNPFPSTCRYTSEAIPAS